MRHKSLLHTTQVCLFKSLQFFVLAHKVCILHFSSTFQKLKDQSITPDLTNELVLSFQYSFGADPVTSLLDSLEEELLKTTHTYCGKSHPLFTKRLAHSLTNISRKAPHGRWRKWILERLRLSLTLTGLFRKTRSGASCRWPHKLALTCTDYFQSCGLRCVGYFVDNWWAAA